MAAGPGTRPEPPWAAAGATLHGQVTPHTPRWASHTAGGSFRLPPFQGRVGEHQDPPTPSPPRRDSRGGQGMGQGCSARTHTSPFPPNWSQSRQTRGESHGVGGCPSLHWGQPPPHPSSTREPGRGDGWGRVKPSGAQGRGGKSGGQGCARRERQSEMQEPRDEGEDAIRGGAGCARWSEGRGGGGGEVGDDQSH